VDLPEGAAERHWAESERSDLTNDPTASDERPTRILADEVAELRQESASTSTAAVHRAPPASGRTLRIAEREPDRAHLSRVLVQ
jgi:hypothetical protein